MRPETVPPTQVPLVPARRAQTHGLELLGKLPCKSLSFRFAEPFIHVLWDPDLPCWHSTCHLGAWGSQHSVSAHRHFLLPALELWETFKAAPSPFSVLILCAHPHSHPHPPYPFFICISILHLHMHIHPHPHPPSPSSSSSSFSILNPPSSSLFSILLLLLYPIPHLTPSTRTSTLGLSMLNCTQGPPHPGTSIPGPWRLGQTHSTVPLMHRQDRPC